ncbi:MAG: hypothetical protein RL702_1833 [Pseudomonadota bacterium]|jgi:hypothetical protein
MRASRFSDAQKAFILKQDAEGVPVAISPDLLVQENALIAG